MRKLILLSLALSALLSGPCFGQYKLIEEVKAEPGKATIPYVRYQLDNGLMVILHEDHSDPLVHVNVTYHVGSAREEAGKSGFAHFFEHMMFQGSKHVADEQHFQIVTEAGGQLNGTTNRDRTNYFETVPSNYLETALWLEADRMGFLLDSVTQRKFEVQRETVKNERGQNYDNVPYGRVYEHMSENAYPETFPYSWLTIGYIEDLNRVGVEELRKFFLRWYGPNNAVLTIGGDFESKATLDMVVKYFGSIPRGPAVTNMTPLNVEAWQAFYTADRYLVMEDKVRQPELNMMWPAVQTYHPDEPALDCLGSILGGGKASRLYAKLVKTQKARSAAAYNSTSELAGTFSISVRAFPDQSLAEIERIVRETLAEFEKSGPTDDEIASYKARTESMYINSLASVSGKCSRLASYQTFTGNPNQIGQALDRVRAVTKEDVMRVYEKYVKGKFAVIHSTVPNGSTQLAARSETWKGSRGKWQGPKEDYSNLQLRPVTDAFDRSIRPTPPAASPIVVPTYWTKTLKNGAKVIGAENREVPLVAMSVTFVGHYEYMSRHPEQAGVGAIAAELLNEGNAKYTAEQMSMELDKLGSSANFNMDGGMMTFSLRSLTQNLDATLALGQLRFLNRQFSQEDFDRIRKRALDGVKESGTQPTEIARKVFFRQLYGKDHPQGLPNAGLEASLTNLTLDHVRQYLEYVLRPEHANVVLVGDLDKKSGLKKLGMVQQMTSAPLNGMPMGGSMAKTPVATPSVDKTRIYLVNKEGAPQSQIWAGYVAMPFDAIGDYHKAGLMNYTLGGMFNSRLNLMLRENRGFTYGARSGFSGTLYPGIWSFTTGVKTPATDSSLTDFLQVVTEYRDKGPTAEELDFLQKSYNQRDALSYETQWQRAGFLLNILMYGLPKGYDKQQRTLLNSLTVADLHALAQKHLHMDQISIVVVGDKKTILPGLQKLGMEIWELDVNGELLSKEVK
jgi:zinc protease